VTSVNGTIVVTNGCKEPMALLTAPIDTRVAVTDSWEESLSSVYARFSVFHTTPVTDAMTDRGIPVHVLPEVVVVRAGAEHVLPLRGSTSRLLGDPLRPRYARLCTFTAPAGTFSGDSSDGFSLDDSIEAFERAGSRCNVRRRSSAHLICSAPVPLPT
jgi:hypothetical protein